MPMTIHVDIVSAEEEIFSGLAEMVFAPAELGEVGIAPRHAPLITRLAAGEVRVKINDQETYPFYVSGGMLEVQPHVVTVLADTAIRAKDIDEAAALEAKRRAEEMLRDKSGKYDYAKAQAELAEAVLQLRTLEHFRKRRS
jgi:F-type H+-transporting ATPase subunit epsilon